MSGPEVDQGLRVWWSVHPEIPAETETRLAEVLQLLATASLEEFGARYPNGELFLELLTKLSPDLLLIIAIPFDSKRAEVVYIRSRYVRELPETKVADFLEAQWPLRQHAGTFWNRVLREDVWGTRDDNPLGWQQAVEGFTFSLAIDKVMGVEQVFLLLKGTEVVPRTQQVTTKQVLSPESMEELWGSMREFEQLQNEYNSFKALTQEDELWLRNMTQAIQYFLTSFGMTIHTLKKKREFDEAKIKAAHEMMERLRQLFDAMPAKHR